MSIHPITYARIDLRALLHNYRKIRADAGCEVLCIVKADGYGHGAIRCACALADEGATFFGVANASEAIELRIGLAGRPAQILILGYTSPEDAALLIEHDITQTVYSDDYAAALLAHIPSGQRLRVHIKLDSGMNRLGFPTTDEEGRARTVAQIRALCTDPRIDADGIFTHFACADEPESPMTEEQWLAFSQALNEIEACGISFPHVHACNSAGIYRMPCARGNLVRAGIILYGILPSDAVKIDGLRPVMSLHTQVTHVHTVREGETVGYGAAYRAAQDTEIATLAIGYADGLIRAYGGCEVRLGGKCAPLIGRICMDQCMVDVTGMSVKPGEEAVFFDADHPVEALARHAGMIPYETVCLIGKRVPRLYRD